MRIKKPTAVTITITAVLLAVFFAGVFLNQDNSTRIYFESKQFILVPINDTTINKTMTQVNLKTEQELANKAQSLNLTTIYTDASNITTAYSYGILENESNTVYNYVSLRWFAIDINPMLPFSLALIAMMITAFLCIRYSD
jgi:hypothetical protein